MLGAYARSLNYSLSKADNAALSNYSKPYPKDGQIGIDIEVVTTLGHDAMHKICFIYIQEFGLAGEALSTLRMDEAKSLPTNLASH